MALFRTKRGTYLALCWALLKAAYSLPLRTRKHDSGAAEDTEAAESSDLAVLLVLVCECATTANYAEKHGKQDETSSGWRFRK